MVFFEQYSPNSFEYKCKHGLVDSKSIQDHDNLVDGLFIACRNNQLNSVKIIISTKREIVDIEKLFKYTLTYSDVNVITYIHSLGNIDKKIIEDEFKNACNNPQSLWLAKFLYKTGKVSFKTFYSVYRSLRKSKDDRYNKCLQWMKQIDKCDESLGWQGY